MGDVTEFACRDGKLYLAGLVDAHDKGFCGWSMSHHNNTDLVVNALVMALVRRNHVEGHTIHHVDQGSPYTSFEMLNRLEDWGLRASSTRTGVCWDNAAMESTWATLKKEIRHIYGDPEQMTRSQLRTVIFEYIETFYNRARHQARLGHRTPAETYAASAAA